MDHLASRLDKALAGRYRIEGKVGHGGMGTVFLAWDEKHGRRVAIKVLHAELSGPVGAERFLREIRTTARLSHPHIVPVHDSGELDGLPYFIMPYIRGESLADRLARQERLPVSEACRIARAVASGLAHAHAQGVIHRDIKPGNILLAEEHARIVDFGVARALAQGGSTRLTAVGLAIGSPLYMSPEQAAGDVDADARTDLYSLGCVLYEMLAGQPPITGESAAEVMAGHRSRTPPPLRSLRPDAPPALADLVRSLLAKDPADRPPTAEAVCAALDSITVESRSATRTAASPRLSRRTIGVTAAVLVGIALTALVFRYGPTLTGAEPALDDRRYVVMPFQGGGNDATALLLHDKLSRWGGIELVDRLQVRDALDRERNGGTDAESLAMVASGLGAGRYIRGEVLPVDGGARVHASVYSPGRPDRPLRSATVTHDGSGAAADSALSHLAEALLFGEQAVALVTTSGGGTRSVPALELYIEGRRALESWDFERADSLFRQATRIDPDYGRAQLWLAQVGLWTGAELADWRIPAERAAAVSDGFPERERRLAEALLAMQRGDYPAACEEYRALTRRDAADFAAWYGLGECHARDLLVVPDRKSPTGWRFRGSYHQAVEAYRTAFTILPSSYQGFSGDAFARIRELLYTRQDHLRSGTTTDDRFFLATASWAGDSLRFLPQPADEAQVVGVSPLDIVERQRELFLELTGVWTRHFPESPGAWEARATALQMAGDPGALEALQRARRLNAEPDVEGRLLAQELWLRLRMGLPDDPGQLERSRAAADTLLAAGRASPAVALLRGRTKDAALLARRTAAPRERPVQIPQAVVQPAFALLVHAAAGGSTDSIARLEREAAEAIRNTIPPGDQRLARWVMLLQPAMLAWPEHRSPFAGDFEDVEVIRAQIAVGAGRPDSAVAILRRRAREWQPLAPPARAIDALYAESRVLYEADQPELAADRLDPTLESIRWAQPEAIENVARVGALIRAMKLRARIASEAEDRPAAARWDRALSILQGGSDQEAVGDRRASP